MQNKDILNLVEDERFCNYCLNANAEDVNYWEDWLTNHPSERSSIEKQKMLVLLLARETAAQVTDEQYRKLQQKIQKSAVRRPAYFSLILRWSVAAAIVLASGLGYYFYQKAKPTQEIANKVAPKALPGINRASLTLADGQTILLSNAKNGKLAEQPGVIISNNAQGQIVYTVVGENGSYSGAESYNTLMTPSGGQYQVILPDGSHVWLNAKSTLKYPARFAGNKREVSLTGEGYFEIAPNPKLPFYVSCLQQRIEVIGTHFNVSCYSDEPAIRTTLLKGKVLVTAGAYSEKLLPGQTLTLEQKNDGTSPMRVTDDPDAEGAIAWKNGLLHFDKANIREVMRVFSRWYNVDVEYHEPASKRRFSGDIPKDQPISAALEILKDKGIIFTVQGRKIIIDGDQSPVH